MGFIEQFFKNKKDVNSDDITRFISLRIEENAKLDYKNIMAYDNADKLATKFQVLQIPKVA